MDGGKTQCHFQHGFAVSRRRRNLDFIPVCTAVKRSIEPGAIAFFVVAVAVNDDIVRIQCLQYQIHRRNLGRADVSFRVDMHSFFRAFMHRADLCVKKTVIREGGIGFPGSGGLIFVDLGVRHIDQETDSGKNNEAGRDKSEILGDRLFNIGIRNVPGGGKKPDHNKSQHADDEFEQPVFHSASPMVFHLSIKFIVTAGNTNDGGPFFQLLLRFQEHDSSQMSC